MAKKKLVKKNPRSITNSPKFGEDPELAALFDKLIKKIDKLKSEAAT